MNNHDRQQSCRSAISRLEKLTILLHLAMTSLFAASAALLWSLHLPGLLASVTLAAVILATLTVKLRQSLQSRIRILLRLDCDLIVNNYRSPKTWFRTDTEAWQQGEIIRALHLPWSPSQGPEDGHGNSVNAPLDPT